MQQKKEGRESIKAKCESGSGRHKKGNTRNGEDGARKRDNIKARTGVLYVLRGFIFPPEDERLAESCNRCKNDSVKEK